MPTTTARTISLATTELVGLASVRHDISRLLRSREVWSAHDARVYDELTEREVQLMPFRFAPR